MRAKQLGYPEVKPLTSYSCELTDGQSKALQAWLRSHDYEFRDVPYARFAGSKADVGVVFYESGKLVVQGKGTQEFVEFVLEPQVLGEARLGYEAVLNPEIFLPRIGVDESGKGDFFGPMCVAGVYANESILKAWAEVGVRDSKTVGSDRRIAELAKTIRETRGCVFAVVPIGNTAYNRLYAQMNNVNRLLAWGHARTIENLMAERHRMKPPPVRAVSDQFAKNKQTVARALMPLGREIELVQRHKAESDLAVAAASILARNEYVTRLAGLSQQFGLEFPKGASAAVEAIGKEFVEKYGFENLSKVAKMHFRTSANLSRSLKEPAEGPKNSNSTLKQDERAGRRHRGAHLSDQ
ncbi:MAG: ribonuclease HIII [Verrucomicrobia bacterium]|nr:ribonuclease HIII [Verrucomicrobiota bacterium]